MLLFFYFRKGGGGRRPGEWDPGGRLGWIERFTAGAVTVVGDVGWGELVLKRCTEGVALGHLH